MTTNAQDAAAVLTELRSWAKRQTLRYEWIAALDFAIDALNPSFRTEADRNAEADVLAAMRRYNSNPQQTIALDLAIRALRAGGEAVAYTPGHCENHKKPGGCPLSNLDCRYPKCDRQPVAAPSAAQPERAVDDAMVERALAAFNVKAAGVNMHQHRDPNGKSVFHEMMRAALTAALNPEAV
jgi:hypothetical protein